MRPLRSTLDLLGFAWICLDWSDWSDSVGFGAARRLTGFTPRLRQNTAVWLDLVGFPWIYPDLLGFGRIARGRPVPSSHLTPQPKYCGLVGFGRISLDLVELHGAGQFLRLTSRRHQNTAIWSDLVGSPWIPPPQPKRKPTMNASGRE